MSKDRFTKLFKYMQLELKTLNEKLGEKASQHALDRLTDTVDAFVKRLDENETEAIMSNRQFEKLVAWARKVSEKPVFHLKIYRIF